MFVRTFIWFSTAAALACAPDPCERLARGFCERGVIDCDTARAVFHEAEVPAERGLDGLGALELAPSDMQAAVLLAVLEDVMKDSPRLAGGRFDALSAAARRQGLALRTAAEPTLHCLEGTSAPAASLPLQTGLPRAATRCLPLLELASCRQYMRANSHNKW